MRKTVIAIISVLFSSMVFCVALCDTKVEASNVSDEFYCSYSSSKADGVYVTYGSDSVATLNSTEAQEKNIPSGYSGNVLVVEGGQNKGVLIDFSENKIPITILESVTFRVYVGDDGISTNSYPEVRIPYPNSPNMWVMRYNASNSTNQWIDITLASDGTNFSPTDHATFETISENGFLNKFELAVRNAAYGVFYIDSITVSLKDDDGVGPVIEYTGQENVYVHENVKFQVTAYDAFERRSIPVEYIWPAGTVLNSNEMPAPGAYKLLLRAVDFYGNKTEKSLNIIVQEEDRQAPVIEINTESIYAVTGTRPMLNASVSDNSEAKIDVTYVWSSGALDAYGKLVKGTHTWTVTAVDHVGNKSEKLVTVYVDDKEMLGSNVIDEQALYLQDLASHELVLVPETKATTDKEGNIAYYYCKQCDKYYLDEAGTKEITREETIIPKLKDGEKSTANENSSSGQIMTGDNILVINHFILLVASSAIVVLLVRRKHTKKGIN